MTVKLDPYINFRDNAREAMEFYHSVLGGEVSFSTFGEFGMSDEPAEKDLIMHSMLQTPGGLSFMAADTPSSMPFAPTAGFALTVSGTMADEEELRGYWNKLAEGATLTMPLDKAPWGDYFGMLTDRFGVDWMFDFGNPQE